jgi:hypothetical protein
MPGLEEQQAVLLDAGKDIIELLRPKAEVPATSSSQILAVYSARST